MAEQRRPAPGPWKPQFFRILLPGFHSKLSIPRTFNKYIVRKLCTMATILSPLGNSWRVQVRGDNTHMYFGEGWEEFCQAHNLGVGCFLVFGYEGEMVFRVTVFDPSTCMKEYPGVVEDNHMDNKATGGSTSLDEMEVTGSAESQKHSHEWQDVGMIKPTVSQEQMTPNNMGSPIKGSFEITISGYCLYSGFLHIPRAFQKISGIASRRNVILRDPKMRLWPTHIYHHHRGKNIQSRFASGWAKFCSNNNLEEGDVCIFETLPEQENFTFHVDILKEHMLPGASDLKSCQEEPCPVVRKSSSEDTTGEH